MLMARTKLATIFLVLLAAPSASSKRLKAVVADLTNAIRGMTKTIGESAVSMDGEADAWKDAVEDLKNGEIAALRDTMNGEMSALMGALMDLKNGDMAALKGAVEELKEKKDEEPDRPIARQPQRSDRTRSNQAGRPHWAPQ